VRLNPDGTADVLTGSQDLGTGTRTVLAQVAAEALGARLDAVRVVLGDTERTPYTANSWGSMTVPSVAPAVRMAAEDARAQLFEAAAGLLDAEPGALAAREGEISAPNGRTVRIAEVMARLGEVMIVGRGTRGPNPDGHSIASFGAQFAEVEVDAETGRVRVLRIVAAHDSGRILNPTLAESQVEGGIIQGLGYALLEERVLDERLGVPLNPTMHDYKIPVVGDVPRIEIEFVGAADALANHTGAKGLGEPPIIPTAPAIANAVADALGVEITELPITPWRVRSAFPG
jgi:xanthine dehydrogenase YagR molybdenum-binding subunit